MLNKKADFDDMMAMFYRLLGLSLILVGGYEVITNLLALGIETINVPEIPSITLIWGIILIINALHCLLNYNELDTFS